MSSLEQKLQKYNIPATRFNEEFANLQAVGFSETDANRLIVRSSSNKIVQFILKKIDTLVSEPCTLTHAQIATIASHKGGSHNLAAVATHRETLTTLGFSTENIVHLVAHDGGANSLKATIAQYATLNISHHPQTFYGANGRRGANNEETSEYTSRETQPESRHKRRRL